VSCTTLNQSLKTKEKVPFVWEAAVYFLMTDRFYNGDKSMIPISTELKLLENYVVLKEVILKESQKKLTKAILIN
jgi:hypothetical protein